MVGDGESETGPLATSWHSNKFLNPITDGAVLPVLHLNGYKINNPTVLARISHEELESLIRRIRVHAVLRRRQRAGEHASGDGRYAGALRPGDPQNSGGGAEHRKSLRPRWPMIILRSPKGWTAPRQVDGHYLEGFWRAHQIPITESPQIPGHLKVLEDWMRSYKPEELFDETGRFIPS